MEEIFGSISDTAPEVSVQLYQRLRQMSAVEKLQRTLAFFHLSRQMTAQSIKRQHPHITPEEFRFRFACKMIGEELAKRYYLPKSNTVSPNERRISGQGTSIRFA